jgi:hypothetical protein
VFKKTLNSQFLNVLSHSLQQGTSSTILNMAGIHSKDAAISQLHELCEDINLPTWDSDGIEISAWLQLVQEALGFWNNNLPPDEFPITLYGQEIAFDDSRNRYRTLLMRYSTNNTTPLDPPRSESQEEIIEKVASWGHTDMAYMDHYIAGHHNFYLSSTQAPRNFEQAWEEGWFNGLGISKENAQSMHSAELSPFHCTALYAHNGQWRIFDSSYNGEPVPAGETRQISSICSLVRFNSMLESLGNRRREPLAVHLGGGVNGKEIKESRELACWWMVERILHIMGDEKSRMPVLRWEQVERN